MFIIPMLVDRSRVFIDGNAPRWVVLHKTAGGTSAESIANYFAETPLLTSSHYIVGQDGEIVQCVRESDGAAANCCVEPGHAPWLPTINLNMCTISIEHIDPSNDNSSPLTDAQKAASFGLIADICQRHRIPMRAGDENGGIIGHKDIAPESRARCPGNYPWQELFLYLNQRGANTMGGIPTAWRDDGHTLIAPNGLGVTQGFRDWILSHNWSSDDVPLSLEQHRLPVQLHAINFGSGQIQCFVKSVLWWTPGTGVIQESQLGAEVYALQSQLDAAHTQISALQAQISSLQAQLSALQAQSQAINPKVVEAIKEIQAINVAGAAALADLEAK